MSYYGDEYSAHSAPHTPRDGSYPQWEVEQQMQQDSQSQSQDIQSQSQQSQPQHEQPQQQQQPPLSFPPPPQQPSLYPPLEDPGQLVPSQVLPRGRHDLTPIRLHPPGRSPPVEIKPIEVDTTVRSTAGAGPNTRPASRARHQHQYHPYRGPTGEAGPSSRREIEAHQHVRFPTNTPQVPPGRQAFPSPLSEYAPSFVPSGSPLAEGSFAAPFVPLGPPQDVPTPVDEPPRTKYYIRADTHYNPDTHVLTALLELPGMKKHDLSITLATTLFNRVRQVTVNGTSRPPFPTPARSASASASVSTSNASSALRERKYGRFTRAFSVPPDTQPEHVDAAMEDGVLTLKISCGVPAPSTDEHEIPIR
ncbi:hypothetical protein C8J57DRAFT_607825 [Mycena rebaudengoi]|nr:hypothetical protein C8J57DRAFT_607825 [Mycena rebaudengoi]